MVWNARRSISLEVPYCMTIPFVGVSASQPASTDAAEAEFLAESFDCLGFRYLGDAGFKRAVEEPSSEEGETI